jgi:hypothetical protein
MSEESIVNAIVETLREDGFTVATEVANFYRSADIGALAKNGEVWVVECKVSNIGQAIQQAKTHKLSADKVFIATFYKNTREITLGRIRDAGLGLIYVMPDGSVSKPVEWPRRNTPWGLARKRLSERIREFRESNA